MCLFSLQVTKNGIWKALMPSIRSRPEGPNYGKKLLLIIWAASGSALPPLPHMLQLLPRFLCTANKTKIMCKIEIIFVLKKSSYVRHRPGPE
jgi:hypothetical protein